MKSLKLLSLYGCERVKRFLDIPQEMENIKYLILAHTAITKLPPSIGNLIGLERLDIGSFFYSCQLPISIYELQNLWQIIFYGNVQFPNGVGIGRHTPCNSSKYCFSMLNFLKKLTSCFTHSKKSKDLNLWESIIRFNRLHWLLIWDSKFLKRIPKLPEGIRRIDAKSCISLNSESLRKLILQVPLPLLK